MFLGVTRRRTETQANRNSLLIFRDYDLAAQKLETLQSCTAELEAKMHYHLATKRRDLNALLPIHRIPSELLVDILATSLALSPEGSRQTYQTHLYALRCVSIAWRMLIDDSPSLWGTVSTRDSLRAVKGALFKSKDFPLKVIYRAQVIRGSTADAFLGLVLRHIHRWRTFYAFDLMSVQARKLLDVISGCHAPNLQELSLFDTEDVRGTGDLFDGQTSQLRQVKLIRSLLVPWNSAMLSNLHVLHIGGLFMEGPSADQVDSILRASPSLVELTLQEFSPMGSEAPSMKPVDPIELFSLRRITMGGLTPELATHLLNNIRIPNCENMIIRLHTSTEVSHSPNEGFLRSARAIMTLSDSADVDFGAALFNLKCWKKQKVVLEIRIGGEDWELNTAESILRLLYPSLDLNVVIDTSMDSHGVVHPRLYPASYFSKILGLVPSLRGARSMRLNRRRSVGDDGSNALIRELAVPTSVDGVLYWPLPRLEMLSVESSSLDVEILLEVIRARLDAGLEPPFKLKSLKLERRLEGHVSELERTLGYGVVSCCMHARGSSLERDIFGGSSDSDVSGLEEGDRHLGANEHNWYLRDEDDHSHNLREEEGEDEDEEGEGEVRRRKRRLDDNDNGDDDNNHDDYDYDYDIDIDNKIEGAEEGGNEEANERDEELDADD
ncbi:hypothetical protein FRB96_003361 [Tulasnella sp. 330]|nr:hypothetical protein FRB96_003361 [Tulasnella sp. 330]